MCVLSFNDKNGIVEKYTTICLLQIDLLFRSFKIFRIIINNTLLVDVLMFVDQNTLNNIPL